MFLQLVWQSICLILRAARLPWISVSSHVYPCCNYWLHRSSAGMDWSRIILFILVLVDTSDSDPLSFFRSHCQERERSLWSPAFAVPLVLTGCGRKENTAADSDTVGTYRLQREIQTEEHLQAHFERKLSSTMGGALPIPRENRWLQCRWVLCQGFISCKETKQTLQARV